MYHDMYVKFKNKEKEILWLRAAYNYEIEFNINLLFMIKLYNNGVFVNNIEYIKIKPTEEIYESN